ncbi:hypothetical protein ABT117_01550 [Streptomyces sp. NPDC002262]|uniref:hypothetical protein n=1 Tax=Streptomyces sp. NPDC002262 TaxID=3154414 RepID=UPI003333BA81
MTWQIALDFIRALIWPGVTLTLGLVFRKQISALFNRLETLETPVGTVGFERQAEALAQEAAEIEGEIAAEAAEAASEIAHRRPEIGSPAPETTMTPLPETAVPPVSTGENFTDLVDLADHQSTTVVLAAWREVEKAMQQAGAANGVKRATPRELEKMGILTSDLARSLDDLRQLRNRVVHDGDIILTQSGTRSYVTAARRITEALTLSTSPALRARRYEEAALNAVRSVGVEVEESYMDKGFDGLGMTGGNRALAIVVKHRQKTPLTDRDIHASTDHLRDFDGGVLVITNAPLSASIRELNAHSQDSKPPMEVVRWQGPEDSHVLARAIARVAR